tara:strand:+ start:3069 stop:3242 length:174 start_codon:yes stop_codon:yes gene_type:complete
MIKDIELSELFNYWISKEISSTENIEDLVGEFDKRASLFTRNFKIHILFSDGSKLIK